MIHLKRKPYSCGILKQKLFVIFIWVLYQVNSSSADASNRLCQPVTFDDVKDESRLLHDRPLRRTNTGDLIQCLYRCMEVISMCHAINYNKDKGTCEILGNPQSTDERIRIVQSPGWVYYGISKDHDVAPTSETVTQTTTLNSTNTTTCLMPSTSAITNQSITTKITSAHTGIIPTTTFNQPTATEISPVTISTEQLTTKEIILTTTFIDQITTVGLALSTPNTDQLTTKMIYATTTNKPIPTESTEDADQLPNSEVAFTTNIDRSTPIEIIPTTTSIQAIPTEMIHTLKPTEQLNSNEIIPTSAIKQGATP